MIEKLEYTDRHEVVFLDQTLLPHKKKYIRTKDYRDVLEAIRYIEMRLPLAVTALLHYQHEDSGPEWDIPSELIRRVAWTVRSLCG